MADEKWLYLLGGVGLLGLIIFLMMRKPEPVVAVAPPPPEVMERVWEQIEAPAVPTPIPTRETNACGSPRFGYPDFSGTPRAGQGCVDSLDCQNHPVPGHPEYQQCCYEDGTCFTW